MSVNKQTRLEALRLAVATTHDADEIIGRAVRFAAYIEDGAFEHVSEDHRRVKRKYNKRKKEQANEPVSE